VLLAVVAGGGCSSGDDDETDGRSPAAGQGPRRWERVAQFTGTGGQRTPGFEVAPDAAQWRVRASCTGNGSLRVALPAAGDPLAEVVCPGDGLGSSTATGTNVLDVVGDVSWEVVVEQQVTTPAAGP
jgi:hypothetical protein